LWEAFLFFSPGEEEEGDEEGEGEEEEEGEEEGEGEDDDEEGVRFGASSIVDESNSTPAAACVVSVRDEDDEENEEEGDAIVVARVAGSVPASGEGEGRAKVPRPVDFLRRRFRCLRFVEEEIESEENATRVVDPKAKAGVAGLLRAAAPVTLSSSSVSSRADCAPRAPWVKAKDGAAPASAREKTSNENAEAAEAAGAAGAARAARAAGAVNVNPEAVGAARAATLASAPGPTKGRALLALRGMMAVSSRDSKRISYMACLYGNAVRVGNRPD
jgi:hypothetical protein